MRGESVMEKCGKQFVFFKITFVILALSFLKEVGHSSSIFENYYARIYEREMPQNGEERYRILLSPVFIWNQEVKEEMDACAKEKGWKCKEVMFERVSNDFPVEENKISCQDFEREYLGINHSHKIIHFLICLRELDFTSSRASRVRRCLLDLTRSIVPDYVCLGEDQNKDSRELYETLTALHESRIADSISFLLYENPQHIYPAFPVAEVGDFTASITNLILNKINKNELEYRKSRVFYKKCLNQSCSYSHLNSWFESENNSIHYGLPIERVNIIYGSYEYYEIITGVEVVDLSISYINNKLNNLVPNNKTNSLFVLLFVLDGKCDGDRNLKNQLSQKLRKMEAHLSQNDDRLRRYGSHNGTDDPKNLSVISCSFTLAEENKINQWFKDKFSQAIKPNPYVYYVWSGSDIYNNIRDDIKNRIIYLRDAPGREVSELQSFDKFISFLESPEGGKESLEDETKNQLQEKEYVKVDHEEANRTSAINDHMSYRS